MTEYYSSMFGTLKHNILLMLSQMEANLKPSDEVDRRNAKEHLKFIEGRIKEIKKKCRKGAK